MKNKLTVRATEVAMQILQMVADSIKEKNFTDNDEIENYYTYLLNNIHTIIEDYKKGV